MGIGYDRVFIVLISFCLASSGCTAAQITTPTSTAAITPTASAKPTAIPIPTVTPIPLPALTLHPGDFYFSVDGQQGFILSRNVAGYEAPQYYQLLDLTNTGGSKFVRVQLDSLGMGYSNTGEVDEAWAKKWEDIFKKAASDGIYVMPVFGVWCDWNDGSGYSTWKLNPFNEMNGGPAKTSVELFISDSPTQELWFSWMKTLIERWQGQNNIIAWEIFSEVNMAPGTTETEAIDFVNSAASIIRTADTFHRPVTASLADFGDWSNFYRSGSIDFINIHPYPLSGKLDTTIITEVRSVLEKYRKPVLIGESGLSFETPDSNPPTLTTAGQADIGIKHAIWAAVVSGAMNGRAFWWEDGYGIYFPALGMPWMQKYKKEELPAVHFVQGVDFSDFRPLTSTFSSDVWGASVGYEKMVLGWYRDAASEPPDWTIRTIPAGQTITITIPGNAANWQVYFYDTKTGTDIISSTTVARKGDKVTITLPDFTDDIAFKMTAQAGPISTPESTTTTDTIAGKWSGTITNTSGTFSTPVNLEIQPGCSPGQVCGTFSAPHLSCSGALFLQEIAGESFVLIEQNVTGAASCASGGYEYLQSLADGTLAYKFSFTPDSGYSSNGILYRP
jgi:hypothetical protein